MATEARGDLIRGRRTTGRARVEVWRGNVIESVHEVDVAVVDPAGRVRAGAGAHERVVFARSSVKPFQALPLVSDGVVARFGITDPELALCCGSHSGEPPHVETAAALLRRIGAGEEALACGAHTPLGDTAAAALHARGEQPSRLHNNCSGKHAGMLALARFHGWPLGGYHESGHPVQQRMLEEIASWSCLPVERIGQAVDGCGVVTFALPLVRLGTAFARFAAAVRRQESAPSVVARAMARFPDMVAGSGRLCTRLMRATSGRVLAKVGHEGVYCASVPGAELGVALKVCDGAMRAAGPALLATLQALGLLGDDELEELAEFLAPELRNTRGERVGTIRAVIELSAADG